MSHKASLKHKKLINDNIISQFVLRIEKIKKPRLIKFDNFFGGAITGTVGGFLLALILADWYLEYDSAISLNAGFIYTYQSMIAGILAIIAAVIGGRYVLRAAQYPVELECIENAHEATMAHMNLLSKISATCHQIYNLDEKQRLIEFKNLYSVMQQTLFQIKYRTICVLGVKNEYMCWRIGVGSLNATVNGALPDHVGKPEHIKQCKEAFEQMTPTLNRFILHTSKAYQKKLSSYGLT